MQISPRYGSEPIITIDGPIDDVRTPFLRQATRLRDLVAGLSDEQWLTGSRCDGWTVQDVIAHLVGVDDFWRLSIGSGVGGSPTRLLEGFDPKATPAAMVEGMQSMTPADTLAQFVASSTALCDVVAALDADGWAAIAETPPGHLPVRLLVHHALWDSWVHERDIAVPLGLTPVLEADEIVPSLRYSAALGPALALLSQPDGRGSLVIDMVEPDAHVVVEVDGHVHVHDGPAPGGALTLKGHAVELLEALSVRRPLDQSIPDDSAWLLAGLTDAFS